MYVVVQATTILDNQAPSWCSCGLLTSTQINSDGSLKATFLPYLNAVNCCFVRPRFWAYPLKVKNKILNEKYSVSRSCKKKCSNFSITANSFDHWKLFFGKVKQKLSLHSFFESLKSHNDYMTTYLLKWELVRSSWFQASVSELQQMNLKNVSHAVRKTKTVQCLFFVVQLLQDVTLSLQVLEGSKRCSISVQSCYRPA